MENRLNTDPLVLCDQQRFQLTPRWASAAQELYRQGRMVLLGSRGHRPMGAVQYTLAAIGVWRCGNGNRPIMQPAGRDHLEIAHKSAPSPRRRTDRNERSRSSYEIAAARPLAIGSCPPNSRGW